MIKIYDSTNKIPQNANKSQRQGESSWALPRGKSERSRKHAEAGEQSVLNLSISPAWETQFTVRNTQPDYLNATPDPCFLEFREATRPSRVWASLSTAIKIKGQGLFCLIYFATVPLSMSHAFRNSNGYLQLQTVSDSTVTINVSGKICVYL